MRVIDGIVEHGDAVGRQLGFPTANIAVTEMFNSLDDGVWIGLVETAATEISVASVSIGRRRTFYSEDDAPKLLEAHLLDFDGDLYDQPMRVRLISRIRFQEQYENIDDLITQIRQDVQITRQWAELTFPHLLSSNTNAASETQSDFTSLLDV